MAAVNREIKHAMARIADAPFLADSNGEFPRPAYLNLPKLNPLTGRPQFCVEF